LIPRSASSADKPRSVNGPAAMRARSQSELSPLASNPAWPLNQIIPDLGIPIPSKRGAL
jgi:hypothetical protein